MGMNTHREPARLKLCTIGAGHTNNRVRRNHDGPSGRSDVPPANHVARRPGLIACLGDATRGSDRAESGLVTLDWLLIMAAIAGIAAVTVLAVQDTVDEETRLPADPAARLVEADVAAAFVMHDALETALAGLYDPDANVVFEDRCEQIGSAFADVVADASWDWNWDWTQHYLQGTDQHGDELPPGTRLNPAHCALAPRDLSAGP